MFPIGHLTKKEVRSEAKKRGLPVWGKKDSTGICFIGHDLSFKEFLQKRIKVHPGAVVNKKGEVIGEHSGVEFYTIGQRHGFKVKAKTSTSQPLFVIDKDIESNKLIVGKKLDLAKKEFRVDRWHWLGKAPGQRDILKARIRHQGRLIPCKIKGTKVKLDRLEMGIAPGQMAAVYRQKTCLGGGIIKK
jgi:tRNA-specific 2-thiouridylase